MWYNISRGKISVLKTLTAVFVAVIIALFPAVVNAEELTGRISDKVVVTISDEPCKNSVEKLIKPEFRSLFQSGQVVWEGRTLELCWSADEFLVSAMGGTPKKDIIVVDSDGDSGTVPVEIFKQDHQPALPNFF